MFGLGMQELVIIAVVAILLFGKNLPGVAKSLGSSYREFRKGLFDLQKSIDFDDDSSSYKSKPKSYSASTYDDYDDYDEATAPKFEPPPGEPKLESGAER
ncbi:MAG: twin-arginine translocase TatA/TatE family subunit [Planctomycetes bacterium]|nr:twin-arginine translocase TatA/TatE family subunit [Planctomycetota bacterium]